MYFVSRCLFPRRIIYNGVTDARARACQRVREREASPLIPADPSVGVMEIYRSTPFTPAAGVRAIREVEMIHLSRSSRTARRRGRSLPGESSRNGIRAPVASARILARSPGPREKSRASDEPADGRENRRGGFRGLPASPRELTTVGRRIAGVYAINAARQRRRTGYRERNM